MQAFHPQWTQTVAQSMFLSPLGTALELPLDIHARPDAAESGSWWPLLKNTLFSLGSSALLLLVLGRLFAVRWRVAG